MTIDGDFEALPTDIASVRCGHRGPKTAAAVSDSVVIKILGTRLYVRLLEVRELCVMGAG